MSMPCSMVLTIASWEEANAASNSGNHKNAAFEERRWRKGAKTWLARPNQEQKSMMFTGRGKSWMPLRYLGSGETEAEEILNLAKLTSWKQIWNLFEFSTMPAQPAMERKLARR